LSVAETRSRLGAEEDIHRLFRVAMQVPSLPPEITLALGRVRPTSWTLFKMDAIGWSRDFYWLDDAPAEHDKAVLAEKRLDRLIAVDLARNPDHLFDVITILTSPYHVGLPARQWWRDDDHWRTDGRACIAARPILLAAFPHPATSRKTESEGIGMPCYPATVPLLNGSPALDCCRL
jgi:hypothetical protein